MPIILPRPTIYYQQINFIIIPITPELPLVVQARLHRQARLERPRADNSHAGKLRRCVRLLVDSAGIKFFQNWCGNTSASLINWMIRGLCVWRCENGGARHYMWREPQHTCTAAKKRSTSEGLNQPASASQYALQPAAAIPGG